MLSVSEDESSQTGNIRQGVTFNRVAREQKIWCTCLYLNAKRHKKYDSRNAMSSPK